MTVQMTQDEYKKTFKVVVNDTEVEATAWPSEEHDGFDVTIAVDGCKVFQMNECEGRYTDFTFEASDIQNYGIKI